MRMCFCVFLYFTACMLYYCNTVGWAWWDWGLIWWLTILLQCFDTVGWVTWPVKISSPNDLYCVEWDVKPYSTPTHFLAWCHKRQLRWLNHSLVVCMFQVHVLFCFFVIGCQYQCNWLPGKTRLWNDLLCVKWDVKPYTLIQSLTCRLSICSNIGDIEWPWTAQWPSLCNIS